MEKLSDYYVYFEDIRKRVLSTAAVFAVAFIVGFFEAGNILQYIISSFKLSSASIVTTSPFQFLDLATKFGMYTGIIVCLPLIIYHLYDFLKDGLNEKEKKLFYVLLPVGLVLFALGFVYSYLILYFYLNSVSALNLAFGLSNVWNVSDFLAQTILASVFLGLVFQFPIVLTFLIRVGIVDVKYLQEKRIYAICGMFIFVGLLPPPDVFSTIIQALPLVLMYQGTIWANTAYALNKRYSSVYTTRGVEVAGIRNGEIVAKET